MASGPLASRGSLTTFARPPIPGHPETSAASSEQGRPFETLDQHQHQQRPLHDDADPDYDEQQQPYYESDLRSSIPAAAAALRNNHDRPDSRSSSASTHAPIKRKPISSTASPLVARFSSRDYPDYPDYPDLPDYHPDSIAQRRQRPEQRFSRSYSIDSPTLYEFQGRPTPGPVNLSPLASRSEPEEELDYPVSHESALDETLTADNHHTGFESEEEAEDAGGYYADVIPAETQTGHTGLQYDDLTGLIDDLTTQELGSDPVRRSIEPETADTYRHTHTNSNNNMSLFTRKATPPHLNLGPANTDVSEYDNRNKPLPKSPTSASKLGSFFGWGATSPTPTEFSEDKEGFSPFPSPLSGQPITAVANADAYPVPATKGSGSATAITHVSEESSLNYCEAYLQTPSNSNSTVLSQGQIEEMEDELRVISAELAASIRREMDLDDLVERLQDQISNPQAHGKRTSDYFSDSGYSSAKFSEYDQAKEEIAQIQRRADQERAQIRLELGEKLQEERSRRRALDEQIKELSRKASQIDLVQKQSQEDSGRVKELEHACEDLRRRLSEERQVKDNFEDLLSALKGELQSAANERDNLRDEVVPQLRARVEGLEAEAAERAEMAYDATKMQQEIESLRSENTELKQVGTRQSIALSRSASIAGVNSFSKKKNNNNNRPMSLARSNTTAMKQTESREVLAERLKDVEAQRDALHSALKNLLERQEFQNRENGKRIKALEGERARLLSASPKKAGYEQDVSNLREEIVVLRRRAEEAIEQKWQVEKGLGGLKIDLDRANEEIASLRSLLREKDILIPDSLARSSRDLEGDDVEPVTSTSLEKAFKDVQDAYAAALERIKALENATNTDEKTKLAMGRLEQSLATVVSQRDLARSESDELQLQVSSLHELEKEHLEAERDLAEQLDQSARRVEELAQQVRSQLTTNASLRTRLGEAVARGEADQRASKSRIAGVQARLHTLESQLVATQTAAEERVTRHEGELAALKEAHSGQLQRLRDASGVMRGGPRTFPPKSPLSPLSLNTTTRRPSHSGSSTGGPRSPLRPSSSSSAGAWLSADRTAAFRRSGTSIVNSSSSSSLRGVGGSGKLDVDEETVQVATLKKRVVELESALAVADAEMQEVVGRMNEAQIQVMGLQEEREEAVRDTRRLQRMLDAEKVKAFENRFAQLNTVVR